MKSTLDDKDKKLLLNIYHMLIIISGTLFAILYYLI